MNTCEDINNIKLDIIKLFSNINIPNSDYINYYNKYNIKYNIDSINSCDSGASNIGSSNIALNVVDTTACALTARKFCDSIYPFPDTENAVKCTRGIVGKIGKITQNNTSTIKNTCVSNIFKNTLQNEKNHLIALSLYENNKNLDCLNKDIKTILGNITIVTKINECLVNNTVIQQNILTACNASNIEMNNISNISSSCIFDNIPIVIPETKPEPVKSTPILSASVKMSFTPEKSKNPVVFIIATILIITIIIAIIIFPLLRVIKTMLEIKKVYNDY